jgi:hypothetical protein
MSGFPLQINGLILQMSQTSGWLRNGSARIKICDKKMPGKQVVCATKTHAKYHFALVNTHQTPD